MHFIEDISFIKTIKKFFPYIVIPQIGMLFYAIYLRINQYDITINRYFVVVFGIWLLCASVYFIFSEKKSLSILPTTLLIFTIFISFGPWGVFQFPQERQLQRLHSQLVEANIYQNGEIVPLSSPSSISAQLSNDIASTIIYLCDYSDCSDIKELFSDMYTKEEQRQKEEFEINKSQDLIKFQNDPEMLEIVQNRSYTPMQSWRISSYINSTLGVKISYTIDAEENESYYFFINDENLFFPLDLNDYTKLYKIQDIYTNKTGVFFNQEQSTLEIYEENELFDTIDVSSIMEKMNDYHTQGVQEYLTAQEMTFTLESDAHQYLLLLESYSKYPGKPLYYDDITQQNIYFNGYLLLKQ